MDVFDAKFWSTQRVHVGLWYILGLQSRYMGTPLGPKYIPYTYMDPLGKLIQITGLLLRNLN